MLTFNNLDEVIVYFDKKSATSLKEYEKNPEDKIAEETLDLYCSWRRFTVGLLSAKGYNKAVEFVNSLLSANGEKLFLVLPQKPS